MWSVWLVFCDCGFHSVCPLIRGLWKLPDGRDWLWGNLGLVLMGGAMLSTSLIQISVDGWGCENNYIYFRFSLSHYLAGIGRTKKIIQVQQCIWSLAQPWDSIQCIWIKTLQGSRWVISHVPPPHSHPTRPTGLQSWSWPFSLQAVTKVTYLY